MSDQNDPRGGSYKLGTPEGYAAFVRYVRDMVAKNDQGAK